ncbi:MAG: hypothetical protein ACRDSP_22670 [Pseudonocardiaceae bacterium]
MTTLGTTTPDIDWTELRDTTIGAVARGQRIAPATHTLGVSGRWNGRDPGITDWDETHHLWTRRPFGALPICPPCQACLRALNEVNW